MSELISGKEALIAWYEGLEIEVKHSSTGWFVFNDHNFGITVFKSEDHQFRLKPRTITLNGIEVPTPFEPKEEDQYWYLDSNDPQGYNTDIRNHEEMFSQFKKTAFCQIGLWRTEEEIKQVVAALRQVFGGSHDN